MSKLLINEHPLQVLPSLAEKIGLNEAIVLQQVHYWLQRSNTEIDGHLWVYNSLPEWQSQFKFWSVDTVRRTIMSLKSKGVLVSEFLSADKRDRTAYYRIDYDTLSLIEQGELCGSHHGKLPSCKTQPHDGNLPSSKAASCGPHDGNLQSSHHGNLPSSLYKAETTTETNSENSGAGAPAPTESHPAQADLLGDAKPPKKAATAKKTEAFDVMAYLLDAGVDPQVASDWLAVRKKKNLPPTLTVMQKLERDGAAAGKSFVETIIHCAERSHAAFYPDRDAQAAQGRSLGHGFLSKQERAEAENARRRAEREANKPSNLTPAEFEVPPHIILQQRQAFLAAPLRDDDVGF